MLSNNEDGKVGLEISRPQLGVAKNSRNSHNDIMKRLRNKMNQSINDLSTMIPLPPSAGSRRPDQITVLSSAVQHMKFLQGSTELSKETNHKPSFMSDDDLRNLITEASGGFIIVVECERGQVLYVTDSVEKILNISQADMVGLDFYELVHDEDVAMVRTHISTAVSESKDRETEVKKSDVFEESIRNAANLCPGAKRSFLCRMKKVANAEDIKNMGTKTTIWRTKKYVFVDDNDPILISYEGFLKSWPPNEVKSSNYPNSRSCLVAVGRILEIDTEETDYSKLGQIREFETRQRADATFVRVDQNFTKIFGYCSDEVIGKSAYSFLHKDDLRIVAEAHHKAFTDKGTTRLKIINRFRAKAGHYVPVKTTSVVFRNPYSKEVDFVATRNVIMSSVPPNLGTSGKQSGTNTLTTPVVTKFSDKPRRKRDLERDSQMFDNPGDDSDIGFIVQTKQAKKVGQPLRINNLKFSNVDAQKENQQVVSKNFARSPSPALNMQHAQHYFDVAIHSASREQNTLANGMLLDQLTGIKVAISAMENIAIKEESLLLLMNVIENKLKRKRGLDKNRASQKLNSPNDVGVMTQAKQTKKKEERLKFDSWSKMYSNVFSPNDNQQTVLNDLARIPHPALDVDNIQRGQPDITHTIDSATEEYNTLGDEMLFGKLGGFDGAFDAIENATGGVEVEDSFSFLMRNGRAGSKDIGNFLNDLPWDLI
ncbi:protein cycle-like [Dendronephthya gigantea]|uniref:protein cycle-like n=1 Tax=Dendronephthya gigantea TaxID=151771 RepID=UPI0010696417|nr:protein cycle-like [Dendronephthya gigantea]